MEEKAKSRLRAKLEELFGIDLRSLALFRIGVGAMVLGDIVSRSFDLRAFYSDSGVLPRSALATEPLASLLSLHMLGGSAFYQACLFLLTGIAALALILGYRSRLANFACWLLMTSLHLRNPLIHQSGDILLQLYLFWGLFLPLGARFAIDRCRESAGRQRQPGRIFSGASAALLLQICFVYWFAAINKTGEPWRDGSALFYVFHLDSLTKPFGRGLLEHPGLLSFLTRFTFWLECLGPLLAFVPFLTGFIRALIVLAFIGFHLGMLLCLNLGPFPYISIVGWLAFLPAGLWDRLLKIPPNEAAEVKRSPRWTNALALTLIAYVLLWNMASMNLREYRPLFIKKLHWAGDYLRLNQAWGMFAPAPSKFNEWQLISARLEDGSEIDLLRKGQQVGTRWRKYLDWISMENHAADRQYYGHYLCQGWNSRHSGGQIARSIQIDLFREKTSPEAGNPSPEMLLLWQQDCP